jgi:epoxyqueuosine reductase
VKQEIENILASHLGTGQFEYGFADLKGLLASEYQAFEYGISILRPLDDAIVDGITEGPTLPYYDQYNNINLRLSRAGNALAAFLQAEGKTALGIRPTLDESEITGQFRNNLRWSFSHKMAATRAGLGWIGKTGLLISKQYGPRMRLTTVLVNEQILEIGRPIEASRCGECDWCVRACPANAANGKPWDIHTDRDLFLDAFACRNKCRELTQTRIDKEASICGICIAVCPIGRPSRQATLG